MEGLSLDNILSEDQIEGLFSGESEKEGEAGAEAQETEKKDDTAEVNLDELFGEPESVGSGNTGKEDAASGKNGSPPNFYSSIATALAEDGIFRNLDKEGLSKVKTADDFADLVSSQIREQLDERRKRIDEALSAGAEPTEVQRYEKYLDTLNSITDDAVSEENEAGETLRKNIIYQDYINRGVSKERALKYVERSLKQGTDIEDAKEALQSNREFFKSRYDELVRKAKEDDEKDRAEQRKRAEEFRASILDGKDAFGEIKLDKNTRQRVYDSVMKPVWTDPETGERLTALQKYEADNKAEFLKNVGLVFVLTDGFKNLDGLVQGRVRKELNKGIRELERTINSTSRTSGGRLDFASGVGDPDSKSTKWDLDL